MPTLRRRELAGSALALLTLPAVSAPVRSTAATRTELTVLDHHLGAFAKGPNEVMKDDSAASVIQMDDKPYRGTAELRGCIEGLLKPVLWQVFKINAQAVDGDVAYPVWEAKPFVDQATDTLVVRKVRVRRKPSRPADQGPSGGPEHEPAAGPLRHVRAGRAAEVSAVGSHGTGAVPRQTAA